MYYIIILILAIIGIVELKNDERKVKVKYGPKSFLELPLECSNNTYCTHEPENYPHEYVLGMFKGVDKQIDSPVYKESGIADRGPVLSTDENDCATIPSYSKIFFIKSTKGVWRLVVHLKDLNFEPSLRLEICGGAGEPCFRKFSFGKRYKPICKQLTTKWKLLVVDEKGKITKDECELPTCCVCSFEEI